MQLGNEASQAVAAPNPYDLSPYTVSTYPETHPDRLALVAQLSGLRAAPVEKCRLLEVGCASGSNLIPMAEALGGSEFVGIDYSGRQIERGQAVVCELGLTNIRLVQQDLLECGEAVGKFDYIVAHGVYSWVSETVREKLLAVCARSLGPQGVAYVSFNAYPGWHLREMIREMMWYRTRGVSDPGMRAKEARNVIEFLSGAVRGSDPYGGILKRECELIRTVDDGYLLHDHLEEENHPCHFFEFCESIGRHGLRFLAEAEPRDMLGNELETGLRQKVAAVTDVTEREQYLDFLRGNSFRRSIVCHRDAQMQERLDANLTRGLFAVSRVRAEGAVRMDDGAAKFSDGRVHVTTRHAMTKAVLAHLAEIYPERARVDDLPARVRNGGLEPTVVDMAALVRELYLREAVELFPRQIDFVKVAGERPVARKLARLQARDGERVTNLLHQTIAVTADVRAVMALLDGTRTREQISAETGRDGRTVNAAVKSLEESALMMG